MLSSTNSQTRVGFTLTDFLVSLTLITVCLAICLPQLQRTRDHARGNQCAAKLKLLGLGMLKYESAFGHFPRGRALPDFRRGNAVMSTYSSYASVNPGDPGTTTGLASAFTLILPYVGLQDVADLLRLDLAMTNRMTIAGQDFNPNLPAVFRAGAFFVCPTDPNTGRDGVAENNYRINFGGSTPFGGARSTVAQTANDVFVTDPQSGITYSVRGNGAFTIGHGLSRRAFADGLSVTALMSERIKGSEVDAMNPVPSVAAIITKEPRQLLDLITPQQFFAECEATPQASSPFNFYGAGRWPKGSDFAAGWLTAGYDATQYSHLAPPNWQRIDCGNYSAIPDTPGEHALVSARAEHLEGVNVIFADGHLKQVTSTIDLTLWRAYGARDDRLQRPLTAP